MTESPDLHAACEDAVIEAFVAGALSERAKERNRLHEALVTYEGVSVGYEHYIKVEDVLEMLGEINP